MIVIVCAIKKFNGKIRKENTGKILNMPTLSPTALASILFGVGGGVLTVLVVFLGFKTVLWGRYRDKRLEELERENQSLRQKHILQEKTTAIAEEKLRNMHSKMQDWEKTKEEFIKTSKLASLEAGKTLGAQMLEQHALQAKHTYEQTEKRIEKSTQNLHENYKDLFTSVTALKQTLQANTEHLDTLKKTLSISSEIGYASEVILENTLKAFGLKEGCDYTLQQTLKDTFGILRPDAIVFLPSDNILVIDSKATKFLYDLAKGENSKNSDAIQKAKAGIKASMEKHIKDLAKKDYATAVKRYLQRVDRPTDAITITTILWLPSDNIVEQLRQLNITINTKVGGNDIFVCGPSGLWAVIGIASQKIRLEKQAENHIKILHMVETLLNSMVALKQSADKLNRGLGSANKAWDQFTKSFNEHCIPTAKAINTLGVKAKEPLQKIAVNSVTDSQQQDPKQQNITAK